MDSSLKQSENVLGVVDSCLQELNAKLNDINIPEKTESIGDSAFYGCSALESIVLPKKLDVINAEMFYGCILLNSVNIHHVTELST